VPLLNQNKKKKATINTHIVVEVSLEISRGMPPVIEKHSFASDLNCLGIPSP
jgi:hypothetical protein